MDQGQPLTLGRYRLVSKLATGGMAEVYRAVLTGPEGFEKPAVVKRMLPELAAQPEYREMFIHEARLMASLSHSNILAVLDFGQADGEYYLALEYVDGVDLGRALALKGPLSPALAIHVGTSVLRGLGYVHAHRDARGEPLGIVHRDVTPHNVMLGGNGDVKLGDFGIAKVLRGAKRTAPGTIKGKLAYMSPEQAKGQAVDARSDLFALGLVLYEALMGQSAYAGNTEAQLLLAVGAGRIAPLEPLAAIAGHALAGAIGKALRPLPQDRWASAEEMTRALLTSEHAPRAGPAEVGECVMATLAALEPEAARPPVQQPAPRSPFSQVLRADQGSDEE